MQKKMEHDRHVRMFSHENLIGRKMHLHLVSDQDVWLKKVNRTEKKSTEIYFYRFLFSIAGGSRTGWQKQWFAHSDPYTTKVDFNREPIWPTPLHYPPKTTLGNQPTKVSFPSYSIASRLQTSATISPEITPSPDTYDTISAFRKITAKNTHITFKSRPGGTKVSTLPAIGRNY